MSFNWQTAIDSIPVLAQGALVTLELTAAAVGIGIVIGLVIALMRLSSYRVLRGVAIAYTDFFRGTPLLVQLFIIYYALPPIFGFVPPPGYRYVAGIIALGLNSGAYVAEIFRSGIQSIDRGQMEAARSLGMTRGQAMRHIILPQAVKRVIPPLGNEFIAMLKDSSLVSVIAMEDLLYTGKIIVARTFQPGPIYIAVALFYLVMTLVISRLVNYTERRLGKSDIR